jgi:HMG (high mobility group) box
VVSPTKKKAKRSCPERKKAPDAPRRPLSAYNIFFLVERERLLSEVDQGGFRYDDALVEKAVVANLKEARTRKKRSHRKSHGKIAFKDLATAVSERWKVLSPSTKAVFEKYATNERKKYKQKMEVWQKQRKKEIEMETVDTSSEADAAPSSAVSQAPVSEPSVVSPGGDESAKPIKIIDSSSPHVPSFAPRDDSLNSMMRRGHAYAALLERKQAEFELRNSMLDHMHMMINYPQDDVAPDVYESHDYLRYETHPVASNTFGLATYAPYHEYSEPLDYYDAAEATFKLAQRTLPPPQPQYYSNTIQVSHPALPSHAINIEGPFVAQRSPAVGVQYGQAFNGAVYDIPPAYDDMPTYGAAVDMSTAMFDSRCDPHPSYAQQTSLDSFPNVVPSVRSLQSHEPIAYDLDEDGSDEGDNDELDYDDESIMGVLNPSADPFSLACVFEA